MSVRTLSSTCACFPRLQETHILSQQQHLVRWEKLIKGEMTPVSGRVDEVRENRTTAASPLQRKRRCFLHLSNCLLVFYLFPFLHSEVTKNQTRFTRLFINMILLSVCICISHRPSRFVFCSLLYLSIKFVVKFKPLNFFFSFLII